MLMGSATDINRSGRPFAQVDVFGDGGNGDDGAGASTVGNPVAVVFDADGLSDDEMARFARWTNLSETSFVVTPTDDAASYGVRIFAPGGELSFAGHPTLGTAHAWSDYVGDRGERLVQQCPLGLVPLRRHDGRLWFAAPEATVDELPFELVERIADALHLAPSEVQRAAILHNGSTWHTLLLADQATVLDLEPDHQALASLPKVGVVGPCPPGEPAAFEVRAFDAAGGVPEDPVTGSLNAGIAQWLVTEGLAPPIYVAAQGARLGRSGRVHVEAEPDGSAIWIGGATSTVIAGVVTL